MEIDLDKLLYSNLIQRLMRLNDKSLILKNPKILKFPNINYNLSPWRSMSIGFNEFSLSTKRINYSYIPESQENFKKGKTSIQTFTAIVNFYI